MSAFNTPAQQLAEQQRQLSGGAFAGSTKAAPGASSPYAKKQARKAVQMDDFKNQGAESAADFNFNQHNQKKVEGTHISGSEVRHMRQNYGLRENLAELQKQKEAGATFGHVAQRQYDNMQARADNVDAKKQRYIDHFNKIGTDAEDSKMLIEDYERNTQGLDADKAFEALEGGRQFDPKGGDKARYDQIKAGEAKERAGNYQANSTDIKNTQTQNVTQDNDINSTVTGDNNYVTNTQDNSVRNYGGDNRSFVYNSNGEGPDTPATMATLAGYYAPSDSPSAKAQRFDFYSTMNKDAQKKYADTSSIAQGAIARANQNSYIDPAAMDKRIGERSEYHKASSVVKGGQIFGDLFGMNGPDWARPDKAAPIEKPDFDEMYDKYTDF